MKDIKEILTKYDKSGPRYTSYPPATYFSSEFDTEEYKSSLTASNVSNSQGISLYIHIPFCNDRCFFCGCNSVKKQVTAFEVQYVDAVLIELDSVSELLNRNRSVIQIHWGGGTPNAISFDLIEKIMVRIREKFTLSATCEIAMECNPADLDDSKIEYLARLGFNRVSIGVQDLREDVLKVVNRRPSVFPIDTLVKKLRAAGIPEVNIDLIYGLPLQTLESFKNTIEAIMEISPDRLVTFSYAHVPWVMKAQKHLEKVGLPTPDEKMSMLLESHDTLTKEQYVAIGMDHYAKPTDPLTEALGDKSLHRNFQGYCTKKTTGQVYAIGCSGITQLTDAYSQNEKDPAKYMELIEKTGFAVIRGYNVSKDEKICRTVINEIMCNLYVDFDVVAAEYETTAEYVKETVEFFPEKLQSFIDDTLLEVRGNIIDIHRDGAFIVRNIAMCFDPKQKSDTAQYSRTV